MSRKREFLMLAQKYKNQKVRGWYASIKFDGQRALWDGGYTRGVSVSKLSFANLDRKTKEDVSTGLWSRYGNVIHAPDWWLDMLPMGRLLDGELWTQRGCFQEMRSIVSRSVNPVAWSDVKFMVFDSPTSQALFTPGLINNPNFTKQIVGTDKRFPDRQKLKDFYDLEIWTNDVVQKVEQTEIKSNEDVNRLLEEELVQGGEGLILRSPIQTWSPHRVSGLLKVKPIHDMEVTIRGFYYGRGKHEGRMGSMLVADSEGREFKISGFTDDERAMMERGELDRIYYEGSPHFDVGNVITIQYVSLTDAGIPREGRYLR